jgi:hypothetical protein
LTAHSVTYKPHPLPRPHDELLLYAEFTKHDGMGVAPEMICFNFGSAEWRDRLPAIRSVAAEFGFQPLQASAFRKVGHRLEADAL